MEITKLTIVMDCFCGAKTEGVETKTRPGGKTLIRCAGCGETLEVKHLEERPPRLIVDIVDGDGEPKEVH